jgi:hypothetical protein
MDVGVRVSNSRKIRKICTHLTCWKNTPSTRGKLTKNPVIIYYYGLNSFICNANMIHYITPSETPIPYAMRKVNPITQAVNQDQEASSLVYASCSASGHPS